jgi:UDP-N-acetylglucosamine acyltransferase
MNQPFSYVDPSAKIAKSVVIEPFTVINKDVEIGEGTWIGSNVTIMEGARIGKNVKIYPGAVISAPPQDISFQDIPTLCIIGESCVLREHITVHRGTDKTMKTVLGKNVYMMVGAHVAHDCVLGDNVILVNNVALGGHVHVGDWAIIGGLSAVHQFSTIGPHAMVGGGVRVAKDVPPFTKASRDPISYVGVNSIGLRRRGFSAETIHEIQNIYRIVYQSNKNVTQAIDYIEAEFPATKERDDILSFIRNSKRGVMRGYKISD